MNALVRRTIRVLGLRVHKKYIHEHQSRSFIRQSGISSSFPEYSFPAYFCISKHDLFCYALKIGRPAFQLFDCFMR